MNENKMERLRVERAESSEIEAMLIAMDGSGYTRKKFTPVSDVSHLAIYGYMSPSADKLTIVHDTKARILTVDGKPEALAALKQLLPAQQPKQQPAQQQSRSQQTPPQPQQKTTQPSQKQPAPQKQTSPQPQQKPARQPRKQPTQEELLSSLPRGGKRQKLNRFPDTREAAVKPAEPAVTSEKASDSEKTAPPQKPAAQQPKQQTKAKKKKNNNAAPSVQNVQSASAEKNAPEVKEEKPPVQKPVIVSGVSRERLDWMLKDLKSEGAKVRATDNADKSRSATVQSKSRESVSLILTANGTVTLAGKPGALFDDVRVKLESKSDLRLLKKLVPTALRYLSESSKIDLSNGITDLNNIGRLSDYSVLLTAPYRALEKFIYDLQQAENINVKMIGQAYEKDDAGHYSLKKGYIKRINSVVYAEVMTALYTEYFATRNFYTHSDNSSDSQPRGISDKAEAQRHLTKLLEVIEYNAKKLSEIGFSVASEN